MHAHLDHEHCIETVLLKGKSVIDDPALLGVATETAVFKHLFARYYSRNVRFTYWHGKQGREVDLVAEIGQQLNLSRHTIADYVKQIYRKLNVSSRAEAALEAARRGLVK